MSQSIDSLMVVPKVEVNEIENMKLLKRIAATFPSMWQNEMKRIHFRHQIRRDQFITSEPEFAILPSLISTGDWVIDVGANVGHYTKRFSELVGFEGRVIAFEPVPETFALLAANVQLLPQANVTLINAALSDKTLLSGMSIPAFNTGLRNFYQAQLSNLSKSSLQVLTMSLDSISINNTIALVKIDVEGHEASVLKGMHDILLRDKPTLIVETGASEIEDSLKAIGYTAQRLDRSPNVLFRVKENDDIRG